MWLQERKKANGKIEYRFCERYTDPMTNKERKVSVVMNTKSRQAQKEAQRRLDKKINERLQDNTPKTLKSLTFHEACDEWFNHYERYSGSKESTIRTVRFNMQHLKSYVPEDVLIYKMNHAYLKQIIDRWFDDNKGYHLKRGMVSILKRVFRYVDDTYTGLDLSILQRLQPIKRAQSFDEVEAERNNYLEDWELTALLNTIDTWIQDCHMEVTKRNLMMFKSIIQIQVATGMRIGELQALKVDNVDLMNRTIEINGTLQRVTDSKTGAFGVKSTTKTQSSYRVIGITPKNVKMIKAIMLDNKKRAAWTSSYTDHGYIFTASSGSPFLVSTISMWLNKATKESGINKHVTTHTLRHTHISQLAQLNVNVKAIQERVGHKSAKTTLEIYSHVTDKMNKDMIEKLEQSGH